jgi:2-keto-4-pentenoate hydratase/2-oxohepta-3-ene-1,7-dioic acid hydratase in catechol pathway
LFHKPKTSITGPFSPIVMPVQAPNVDYENELCFIISRDAKDVSVLNAPDYVLGYTVGNDVSSRKWQMPDTSGGQFCFAKSFDGFCPIGPMIVAASQISDPHNLRIVTRRNGKVVQDGNTSDMIFNVYKLISFLSQGTTLAAGTLVMTGTPPGVAMFASDPPDFLKEGEVVECEIEALGTLKNKFVSPD